MIFRPASLFILLALFLAPLLSGAQDLVLQKDDFERNLTVRLEKALEPFAKAFEISIYVQADLKNVLPGDASATPVGGSVFLEKLGLDAPSDLFQMKKHEASSALREVLLGVNVSIVLPNTAPADAEKEIEIIAKRVLAGLGKIPNKLKIEKSEFLKVINLEKEPIKAPNPWITPLAVVFSAVLLLAFFGWISRSFLAMETKKIAAMENQNFSGGSSYQSQPVESYAQVPQANTQAGHFDGAGVRSLRHLARKDQSRLSQLLKNWIRTEEPISNQAAIFCSQYLGFDILEQILSRLDETEKGQWLSLVSATQLSFSKDELDQYISKQIAESVMSQTNVDQEAKEIVFDLTPSECAEIASRSPELGASLVHYLPSLQTSRLMTILGEREMKAIVKASLSFDKKSASVHLAEITRIKKEVRSKAAPQVNVFVSKAKEFVKDLDSAREKSFYETLVAEKRYSECEMLAQNAFPFFLIPELPANTLKAVLNTMPIVERTEILLTFDESAKQKIVACYGDSGKLRELLDLQLEQMSVDFEVKKKIETHKLVLQKKFLSRVRQYLQSAPSGKSEIDSTVASWLKGSSSGGHNAAA